MISTCSVHLLADDLCVYVCVQNTVETLHQVKDASLDATGRVVNTSRIPVDAIAPLLPAFFSSLFAIMTAPGIAYTLYFCVTCIYVTCI